MQAERCSAVPSAKLAVEEAITAATRAVPRTALRSVVMTGLLRSGGCEPQPLIRLHAFVRRIGRKDCDGGHTSVRAGNPSGSRSLPTNPRTLSRCCPCYRATLERKAIRDLGHEWSRISD